MHELSPLEDMRLWAAVAALDTADAVSYKRMLLLFDRLFITTSVEVGRSIVFSGRHLTPVRPVRMTGGEDLIVTADEDEIGALAEETFKASAMHCQVDLMQCLLNGELEPIDHASQALAVIAEATRQVRVVPVLYAPPSSRTIHSPESAHAAALQVVYGTLPLPDAETPWEAIRDWRNDEEARRQYALLRVWISRMANANTNAYEIAEALAGSLAEYTAYMDIQHAKFRRGRLEVFLSTAAEVIENIAKLNLSTAVRKLFEVSGHDLLLREAEISAPGKEIAYIVSANRRFAGE